MISGDRALSILDYSLTITENIHSAETSLYQALFKEGEFIFGTEDFARDEDYDHEYEEPALTGNLLEKFDYVLNPDLAYGNYFMKQLFGQDLGL